jgi:hypothetical protein
MSDLKLIEKICDQCIIEGNEVLATKWDKKTHVHGRVIDSVPFVDLEAFKKWKSNCNVLMNMLGELSKPWSESIDGQKSNAYGYAIEIQGALKSIKQNIENGYLIKIEDLIFSEAFSNLLEQAEYLLEQNYFLASAVISRTVLEEKLRNICSQQKIDFPKSKPTLSDYNQELYKINYYSKVEYKHIDYLTSIGNNAAHNNNFENADASKLLEGVKAILNKYS